MSRFRKTRDCPASETLLARREDRLAPLAAQAAESHLKACEFCRAESALLAHAGAPGDAGPHEAPPLPLALRLYAESRLAAAAGRAHFMRAA